LRQAAVLSIIILAIAAIGCAGDQAAVDGAPIGILPDRHDYTPLMSSTVGIGLIPEYPASVDNQTVSFRWHTDYGYFLTWGAPDFRVSNEGQYVTGTDNKIYWSYSPDEMGREKPPAHVTLEMIERASGRVINITSINIAWIDRDVAEVVP
jgi:hypothetical protein